MEQKTKTDFDMESTTKRVRIIQPSKYEAAGGIQANEKYWKRIFDEIDASITTPTAELKSQKIFEVLPRELYEKVCKILQIPIVEEIKDRKILNEEQGEYKLKHIKRTPLLSYRQTLEIERDLESDTEVEISPRDQSKEEENVHYELLCKPEREQITWPTRYLQPERDEEKTLVRRADDVTDRIVNEFCSYMKELGGDQQSQLFTPKAVKELFQIEFDKPVARGLRVITKELPSVPDSIANATGHPKQSQHDILERELSADIHAEGLPDRAKAFERSLPPRQQWRAPRNNTHLLWQSSRHVPRDLVTLKAVWEGITNLRSVREYCRWMIEHPEYRRPPYLNSLGMFDIAVLEARHTPRHDL